MTIRRYTAILIPEPDGSAWNAKVPMLPGCFTFGATPDEALVMARDAIATYVDGEDEAIAPEEPAGKIVGSVSIEAEVVGGVVRVAPASFLVPEPEPAAAPA